MTVFLEDDATVCSVGVTIGLGELLGVVGLEVSLVLDLSFLDYANVDIGTRAKIVVDTGFDGFDNKLLSLLLGHRFAVACLHDGHSCERS